MCDTSESCRKSENQPGSTVSSGNLIESKSRSVQYAMGKFTEELTMVSSYRTWHTCRCKQFTKKQGNLESRMRGKRARPVRRGEVDVVPGKGNTPSRNARPPTLHKLTTRLIRENQVVCVESLAVKNLLQHPTLAKAIADVGWG